MMGPRHYKSVTQNRSTVESLVRENRCKVEDHEREVRSRNRRHASEAYTVQSECRSIALMAYHCSN